MQDLHAALDWLRAGIRWAPQWLIAFIIFGVAATIGSLLHRSVYLLLARLARRLGPFAAALVRRSADPVGVIWLTVVIGTVLPSAGVSPATTRAIGQALLVAFILALGWGALNALDLGADVYLHRFRTDIEDNLLARKHVTQIRILRGAAKTLIVLVTASAALMTFQAVRQYGVSLFASAGVASLVVGLSARPLFSNLIAGVQIAITQPIRLEDAVVVEGEWGWIETIGSTYVVIRIWDLRRLVVPLTYFIEKPFQNWTKEAADLLGSVHLEVDYTVPLQRLREKLQEIAQESRLWDGKVAVLQVEQALSTTLRLRALVSARNSGEAWDLRCDVREKLIAFLQEEYPHTLPRRRVDVEDGFEATQFNPAAILPVPRRSAEAASSV
jgi:small-conductance mechanosensitive channel